MAVGRLRQRLNDLYDSRPGPEAADRAVVEWVVRGARGTALALTATADRAGTVRTEVTLD